MKRRRYCIVVGLVLLLLACCSSRSEETLSPNAEADSDSVSFEVRPAGARFNG